MSKRSPRAKKKDQKVGHGRVAVLSCIHGNLEALSEVVKDIDAQPGIDDMVCLGDLVGYGPEPNGVVELIASEEITTVMGCWDEGIANDNESCGCSFVSEAESILGGKAFAWTKNEIFTESREFLQKLPFAVRLDLGFGKVLFVHGSPTSTSEYLTESTHDLVLLERAARGECDMLVCGHTHVPFVKNIAGALQVRVGAGMGPEGKIHRANPPTRGPEFSLTPKTIVNAGSVGEPRHGGLQATYVIIDGATGDVEIRVVPYDVEATAEAMRSKDIDPEFIARLRAGRELTGKTKESRCAC